MILINGDKKLIHEYQRLADGDKRLVHEYQRLDDGDKRLVHEYQRLNDKKSSVNYSKTINQSLTIFQHDFYLSFLSNFTR